MKFRPVGSLVVFFWLKNLASCDDFQYLSNFKFEKWVVGDESLMKDYVSLANDPKANFADSFTICSSYFFKFWSSGISIVQMMKEDGSHWFHVNMRTENRKYETMTEWFSIYYENPATGEIDWEDFTDVVPIVPHSWYHVCLGLDTVTGLLRIVVNGIQLVNEEKDYFKNTNAWKPTSLEGKIVHFKGYWGGFWYQYRHTFSNMNIFSSMMAVEDMVTRTAGGEGCSSPGDYLRYSEDSVHLENKSQF